MGPSLLLKVMSGDRIDIAVKDYYNTGTTSTPGSSLTDVLASLATGIVGASGGAKGSLIDLNNTSSSPVYAALNSFLTGNDPNPSGKPKAYLNWILLDEQLKYVSSYPQSGAIAVRSAGVLDSLIITGIPVTKSGYLYIWVSNETPNWDVFFDNLRVVHYTGPLLEETHYYPFGLTMAGISSKALKPDYYENRMKYNEGSELQNKEFSDGSGLELYDFNARTYDPQIGRFGQLDGLSELDYDINPYAYANNNPILFNDPTGLISDSAHPENLTPVIFTGKKPLDTKNGQVYPSRNPFLNFFLGDRIWIGHSHIGKKWYEVRYLVDSRGYLTGKVAPNKLVFDAPIGDAPILSPRVVFNIKNFIKGRYVIYRGVKDGLDYIGKARGGLEFRYTVAQAQKLEVAVIEGLDNLPSNAVALGVEQLVIDLNGGAGTGELANKINATVKEIYINEARSWLDANMPNWEQTLKFK
jgi:RHS repeat-associated protein